MGEDRERLLDLLMEAWGVIANASDWDRSLQRQEWREAATRWRDKWHEEMNRG